MSPMAKKLGIEIQVSEKRFSEETWSNTSSSVAQNSV
jgi:hypothetical protein